MENTEVTIRPVQSVDEMIAAEDLFDAPARSEWAERFLAESGHYLLVAYADDRPCGFVSAVETTHPDKGTEMLLYELAVADDLQNRGIGRVLINALIDLARARGCYGMWVLTDRDNEAAMATYRAADAADDGDHAMLTWSFS